MVALIVSLCSPGCSDKETNIWEANLTNVKDTRWFAVHGGSSVYLDFDATEYFIHGNGSGHGAYRQNGQNIKFDNKSIVVGYSYYKIESGKMDLTGSSMTVVLRDDTWGHIGEDLTLKFYCMAD